VTDHILELSTTVEPAKTFTVDDESYELLGFEHLSPEDEAKATGAFTRFGQLARRLDSASNDSQAATIAKQLRTRRVDLIAMLTTIPRDVAEKLPLSAQIQLFRAVREETGQDGLDDDEGFDNS